MENTELLTLDDLIINANKYGLYTKRDLEKIIREVWLRGNRHLLHNDGRNSLFKIYEDYGLITKPSKAPKVIRNKKKKSLC